MLGGDDNDYNDDHCTIPLPPPALIRTGYHAFSLPSSHQCECCIVCIVFVHCTTPPSPPAYNDGHI